MEIKKHGKFLMLCRNCHLRDENLADLADAAFHLGRLKVGIKVPFQWAEWFKWLTVQIADGSNDR